MLTGPPPKFHGTRDILDQDVEIIQVGSVTPMQESVERLVRM
jgi:hypothetical protein